MFIDTHAHINFNAFREDSSEVLKRTLERGMWVVMPGTQYSTSRRAVEIAQQYERGVYAAVGLHPIHIGEQRKVDVWEVQSDNPSTAGWMTFRTSGEEFNYGKYRELALRRAQGKRKVVAIGEIGLDYYYFPKSKAKREQIKQKQKEVLQRQMDLANELGLPVILHCRVAHEDLLELIDLRFTNKDLRGVVHCYTGTAEQAQKFMEFGLYLGFNGLIFKNVPALPKPAEVISAIPLERIVLETDSPYLVPPAAGQARNEPLFVRYVAEKIASIKKTALQEVAEITADNAKKLFTFDSVSRDDIKKL